jgi:hypothetical protein
MKSLILAVALTFTLPVFAEAEKKKACVMQKDQKTGKEKEVCKEIKVHKKLEGTAVPEKK